MTKEQYQQAASECFNRTEFAEKLGYKFFNGTIGKKLTAIIEEYNLDTSHFDSFKKNREKSVYEKIIKTCPVCEKKFETLKGHKKEKDTCSCKCSYYYFKDDRVPKNKTKLKHCIECGEEIEVSIYSLNDIKCDKCNKILDRKIKTYSNSEKQYTVVKKYTCSECGIPTKTKTKYGKCKKCFVTDENYRKKLSQIMTQKVIDGTHSGWMSRNNPSYPEKFFMKVLNNLNIDYIFEKREGKYFIDFAIEDKNIALEIDGKQHEYEDRKEKDNDKDLFLTDNGWKVYRIKWRSINSEEGKKYIKEEIDKFKFFVDNTKMVL